MIYVITGTSAVGKNTILNKLLTLCNLVLIVPYTTRQIRAGEIDGIDYHFIDKQFLLAAQQNGTLIEMREYNTTKGLWIYATIDDGWGKDLDKDYIIILPPKGYESFCKYFGKENVELINLYVPDGIRLRRSIERDEQQEVPNYCETCRRFLSDKEDFKDFHPPERNIFLNDDPDACVEKIINTFHLHRK